MKSQRWEAISTFYNSIPVTPELERAVRRERWFKLIDWPDRVTLSQLRTLAREVAADDGNGELAEDVIRRVIQLQELGEQLRDALRPPEDPQTIEAMKQLGHTPTLRRPRRRHRTDEPDGPGDFMFTGKTHHRPHPLSRGRRRKRR